MPQHSVTDLLSAVCDEYLRDTLVAMKHGDRLKLLDRYGVESRGMFDAILDPHTPPRRREKIATDLYTPLRAGLHMPMVIGRMARQELAPSEGL